MFVKIFTKAILLWMLIFSINGMGQTYTQSIHGVVLDKDSKMPLPGANIVVLGNNPMRFAQTDGNGMFKIDSVPVGHQSLKVTFLGYEEAILPNLTIGSGREVVLNVEMQEAVQKVNTVEVKSDRRKGQAVNEYSLVSTRTVTVEQTNRYAGSFTDLTRATLTLPGVSNGGGDIDNQIVIRGNSPRGLLWQLEGIEVPSPNHFNTEGASSGAVSAIANYVLGTSDFSTGAFAPEYGNALSGVFDVKLRKGNTEKHEFTAEASLLGLSFGAEGPFKKGNKASYLFSYRYSTLGVLPLVGLHLLANADPGFQDLCFKVNVPTNKAGVFSIFTLAGKSDLTRTQQGYIPAYGKIGASYGTVLKDDEGSDFLIAGASNNYIFNEKMYLHSVVAFTASQTRKDEQDLYNDLVFRTTEHDKFVDYAAKASFTFNYKLNRKHDLKAGFMFSHLGYDFHSAIINDSTLSLADRENEKGGTQVLQTYADWKWRIFSNLTWNSGYHIMYFLLNGRISFEPRTSIKWQLSERQTLSAGFGIHSRREALITYQADQYTSNGDITHPNHGLDFTKAVHLVLGYDNMLMADLHLKVEAYYQYLYEVPIRPGNNSYSTLNYPVILTSTIMNNNGTGKNYGLELTFEKFFGKGYYFMVNGSLYESKYVPSDGIERNTKYNGNYIFNALGGQEFKVGKKKNNAIAYGLRATAAGGKRYTPLNETATATLHAFVYQNNNTYGAITPAYYRFDVYISYTTNYKKCNVTYRFDVQNVTNRHNVYDIFPNYHTLKLDPFYQGTILPVLDIKVEW